MKLHQMIMKHLNLEDLDKQLKKLVRKFLKLSPSKTKGVRLMNLALLVQMMLKILS